MYLDPGLFSPSILPDNINNKRHIQMLIELSILQAKRHNAIFWEKAEEAHNMMKCPHA